MIIAKLTGTKWEIHPKTLHKTFMEFEFKIEVQGKNTVFEYLDLDIWNSGFNDCGGWTEFLYVVWTSSFAVGRLPSHT